MTKVLPWELMKIPPATQSGVQLITKGWYLTVKYYERTPPTATALATFTLAADEMIIDAEGVIFTEESLRLDIAASGVLHVKMTSCFAPSRGQSCSKCFFDVPCFI